MAIEIKQDQAYAYSELLEILSLMEDEYVNRVPKKLINVFKAYRLQNYQNHINPQKTLEEQGISKKTSALLAMLSLKYWCDTPEQRQDLQNALDENEKKYQEELRQKYNPDNVFANNTETTATPASTKENIAAASTLEVESIDQSALPMDYNSFPWYKKMFTKVRNFFYKMFKIEKNPT